MNQPLTRNDSETIYCRFDVADSVGKLLEALRIRNRGKFKNFLNQLVSGKKLEEVSATTISLQLLGGIVVPMCQGIDVVPANVLDPLEIFLNSARTDSEPDRRHDFFQALGNALDSEKVRSVLNSGNKDEVTTAVSCVGNDINAIKSYEIFDQGNVQGSKLRYIVYHGDRELDRSECKPSEINIFGRKILYWFTPHRANSSYKLWDIRNVRSPNIRTGC